MLRGLLLALPVLAAAAVLRWIARPTTDMGRRRFPIITVSVLLIGALVVAIPVWRRHTLERRLSAVASRLVGARVTIDCLSGGADSVRPGSELGYVAYRRDGTLDDRAMLSDDTCAAIDAWLHHGRRATDGDQRRAVHVLAHESAHLAGITSEALAECWSMDRDAQTAELLGARPAEAQRMAETYRREDHPQLPADYQGGCPQ